MVQTKRNQEKVVATKMPYGKTKWKMKIGATKIQPDGSEKRKLKKKGYH